MSNRVSRTWKTLALATGIALAGSACGSSPEETSAKLGSSAQSLGACVVQPLSIVSASASGVESNHFLPSWAIDHDLSTRWSSGNGAPQWLTLDLGKRSFISGVKIDWETAFSSNYQIEVSDNNSSWAPLRQVKSATGGHQEIADLNVNARYLRVYCNTVSSYKTVSIREIEIDGTADTTCDATPSGCGDSVRLGVASAQASSAEFTRTPAIAAFDDVYSTRWSSAWADNQWLAFDLGSVARVDRVRITWEHAFAKAYAIETATSMAGPWTQVALVSNGAGLVESVDVAATTQFLRMNALVRGTGYGVSTWEIAVYGSKDLVCGENLLTGWTSERGPGAYAGSDSTHTDPNFVSYRGTYFCPGEPVGRMGEADVSQSVTVTEAGSHYRLTFDVTNFSGPTYGEWSYPRFRAELGDLEATTYIPLTNPQIYSTPSASTPGNGSVTADFDVQLAAGQTVTLTLGMTPLGFAAGTSGCGSTVQNFYVENAKLVALGAPKDKGDAAAPKDKGDAALPKDKGDAALPKDKGDPAVPEQK